MATTKITNPELFDLGSLNTALRLPSGSTDQRPTSPSTGEWRYNTTTNLVEFYDGADWRELQSENLPPIASENFNTVLYSGNGSTQAITGVGFKPDWVWIKERSAAESHRLFDSTRGATKRIFSDNTNGESTASDSLTSFDSDGFSLGSSAGINESGQTYVAWCWKVDGGTKTSNTDGSITSNVQVNQKTGISIITYTGNGSSGATIGHGLSSAPEMLWSRRLTGSAAWGVYNKYNTGSPAGQRLKLDTDDQTLTTNDYWAGVEPTSSVFSVGTENAVNKNGQDYLMYAFHSIAGYSKLNTYTGNGSSVAGPIINTGFEPAYVIIKRTDGIDDWIVVDNKRNTVNSRYNYLMPNSSAAENGSASGTINPLVNFLTNGFQIAATWGAVNSNGSTYIYMAFASDLSAAPALPDSFGIETYQGNGGTQSLAGYGFTPSMIWFKARTVAYDHGLYDIVRGGGSLIYPDLSQAASTVTNGVLSFDSGGVTIGANNKQNASDSTYVGWAWKANPVPTINTDGTIQSVVSASQASGFSIVKYTGDGSASSTVGHGLGVIPDLTIFKKTNGSGYWNVFDTANNTVMFLNETTAAAAISGGTNGAVDIANMTSTKFGFIQGSSSVNNQNGSGSNYIVYAFKSIAGFSKISTYTGTGTAGQAITTGFEPSWILIKSTVGNANWRLYDTARGIDAGFFRVQANNTEDTLLAPNLAITATGFEITANGVSSGLNGNGNLYFYMAFKENPTQYPISSGEMGYLVVAGGGGGGAYNGGGGGAGGLRTTYGTASGGGASVESNITLSAQTYTITVGAGGNGQISNTASISGSSSSVASITSIGGGSGGGAPSPFYGPNNGGSGGGGAYASTLTGGTGTANQGFDGGDGDGGVNSGGGGGAGSAGANATGAGGTGGNGGNGVTVAITGSNIGYAGGGGGAGYPAGAGAAGGASSGGGAGGANSAGGAGTANTGGGGGGSQDTANPPNNPGGNGGSGVVVLRLNTSDYSGTTTGSPTVTTNGSETILTYTGSGTYVHS